MLMSQIPFFLPKAPNHLQPTNPQYSDFLPENSFKLSELTMVIVMPQAVILH